MKRRITALLLELLEKGRPAVDGNRQPVLDEHGNQVRTMATAADINSCITWYNVLRDAAAQGDDDGDEIARTFARIRAERNGTGLRIADPDAEDDADDVAAG